MTEQKSVFQVIVFGVFAFFIVIAVLVFAGLSAGGGGKSVGDVVLWGTLDQYAIDGYLSDLTDVEPTASNIFYKQIDSENFQSILAEAIADGSGPDLILISQSDLIQNQKKITKISFDDISERKYKDNFIDEGEMFLTSDGILALPFSIDPMVLYWNRDIFAEAGYAKPPKFWSEMFSMSENITKKDNANNIYRSTIAFGEFDNVDYAKDIISMLIMQAGGDIIRIGQSGEIEAGLIPRQRIVDSDPTETAVRFYTEFSNPATNIYTWNRSLPKSLDAFTQGKLAMYIGYASEIEKIKEKNSNLNFDITTMPQIRQRDGVRVLTFGKMYAFAIPRAAKNSYGAKEIAIMLTKPEASKLYSQIVSVPSPRRDILSKKPKDAVSYVFRDSALISSGWFDPNSQETDKIFRRMIGNIAASGASKISDAVQRANQELDLIIKR